MRALPILGALALFLAPLACPNEAMAQTNVVVCLKTSGGGCSPVNSTNPFPTTGTVTTIDTITNPVGVKGANGSAIASPTNPLPVLGEPTNASAAAIAPVVSAAAESGHVLCSAACNLYSLEAQMSSVAGYVLLFNAISAPADGAVTPIYCYYVNAPTGWVSVEWRVPARFTTGLTAVFSTTGCFTKTASATAMFASQVSQ